MKRGTNKKNNDFEITKQYFSQDKMFEIYFKNSVFDLLSKINKKDHMSKETETDEIQNSFMTSVK